jgi:hypothetical protein
MPSSKKIISRHRTTIVLVADIAQFWQSKAQGSICFGARDSPFKSPLPLHQNLGHHIAIIPKTTQEIHPCAQLLDSDRKSVGGAQLKCAQ